MYREKLSDSANFEQESPFTTEELDEVKELEKKLTELNKKDRLDVYSRLADFGQKLIVKYSDKESPDYFQNCLLFHKIAGSSAESNTDLNKTIKQPTLFDFPGEDSIKKFVDNLYFELIKSKQD